MTTENFAYWLQGFVELTDGQSRPSEMQWILIKRHLDLVFNNVTSPAEEVKEVKVVKLNPSKRPSGGLPHYCSGKRVLC
jgi:hypothetical protein